MKAVIMVAGKSTRTYPLTCTRPKALLKIANKTILEHQVEALSSSVDEIILVVGYKKEMIIEFVEQELQKTFPTLTFTFIEQKEQLGTGHVLTLVEEHVGKGSFLIMNGDDIYGSDDLKKITKQDAAILVCQVDDISQYGIVSIDDKKNFKEIKEKPPQREAGLANCGVYVFSDKVFSYKDSIKKSPRGEYEIVDFLSLYAKDHEVKTIEATVWFPVSFSWSLLDANSHFLSQLSQNSISKEAVVEENVTIKGNVVVGKGTVLKSGTYIEGNVVIGENCKIGPNCYIRGPTSIADNSKVGNAVEIKASILGEKVSVGHLSYVGDSVIGNSVNFGAGTITANLRHDNQNVKSEIKQKILDTGRRKLGTIMGDGVHTGIHTSISPGRKLWPHTSTVPGEVINRDIRSEGE